MMLYRVEPLRRQASSTKNLLTDGANHIPAHFRIADGQNRALLIHIRHPSEDTPFQPVGIRSDYRPLLERPRLILRKRTKNKA